MTREEQAEKNRAEFAELVKYVDELKKTGGVKLLHAVNFATGYEIGKRPND